MLEVLSQKHLANLKEDDVENKLLVYYGFSNEFVLSLSKEFELFTDRSKVLNNLDQLQLDEIFNNAEDLVKRYFSRDKKTKILFYEELLVLLTNVSYQLVKDNIVIVKNSISDVVANQTDQDFPDIDEGLYLGKIKDQPLLSFFYTDSYIFHSTNFLKLRSYSSVIEDNLELTEIDFFDFDELKQHELEISKLATKPESYVIFDQDDSSEEITEIKSSINQTTPVNTPILLRDENQDSDEDLRRLQAVFVLLGIELQVFVVTGEETNSVLRKELTQIFHSYWGEENKFRNLLFYGNPGITSTKNEISQIDIIEDIIEQSIAASDSRDYSDIFITAPTGAGKSLMFQLPAMYLAEKEKRLTIVISPLIALMRDQVASLKHKKIGYAAFLNSELTPKEKEETLLKIKEGDISIVYLSPELLLSYSIETFIGDREVGLLVIDEAHLVTTWGRDFRADYWYIGNYIKRARKMYQLQFPMVALTATAVYGGPEDIVFSTINSLSMHAEKLYIGNVRRDEIHFKIEPFEIEGSHGLKKLEKTVSRVEDFVKEDKKAIVYFPWTNHVRDAYASIDDEYRNRVGKYYGQLDKNEKDQNLRDFMSGKIKVMLATKAFGMGVDVSDIDIVYHHAASGSLTDYVQEIGRVARKQNRTGLAMSDFNKKDLSFVKILYGLSAVKLYQLTAVLIKINEIYNLKKQQNFLISTEDFSYLFEASKDRENQVKSSLLLIEKDFLNKYQFPVVLARPKSLYSQVFCCVERDVEDAFIAKYGKYARKISSVGENGRGEVGDTRVVDYGDIFKLNLDELWEDQFVDISFAQLKRSFYNKEVFSDIGDVSPRYEFFISLKNDAEKTSKKLDYFLASLKTLVARMGDTYHSESEIDEIAYDITKTRTDARKLVNVLLTLYVSQAGNDMIGGRLQFDTFIQARRTANTTEHKYRVFEARFSKSEYSIRKRFAAMFDTNNGEYRKFVASSDVDNPNMKLAFALEILGLANYQISGGRLPKIFIRVNDPYKLKSICDNVATYTNELLNDIKARQNYGVDKMESFLTEKADDVSRWDSIERYFLNLNE